MGKSARPRKTVKEPAADAAGNKAKARKPSGPPSRFSAKVLVAAAFAAGLLALLLFVVHWLAAVSIASGLWVFADASLMRLTRLKPSGKGFRLATMVWGAIGFAPFVGIAVYVYLRGALARSSTEDVAPPSMSAEKAKEAGRLRAQKVSVPGAAVVVILAATVALAARHLADGMTLEFGTDYTRALRITGAAPRDRYDPGTIAVKLSSPEPIAECGALDWKLHPPGGEGGRVRTGTVKPRASPGKTIWVWKLRWLRTPGEYRLHVLRDDGKVVKRGYFTVRPKR